MKLGKNAKRQAEAWELLDEIDKLGDGLSDWEIEFVEDLVKRRAGGPGYTLSEPQIIKIEQIHERRVR